MKLKSKKNKNPNKRKFKETNWPAYNKALVSRGNISLFLSPEIAEAWLPRPGIKQRGAQRKYSDYAIEPGLTFKAMFSLTLLGTRGFLIGLAKLAGLDLPIPCFSTFSRRGKALQVAPLKRTSCESAVMIVDSTGLKIFGEAEWQQEKHQKKAAQDLAQAPSRCRQRVHPGLGVNDSLSR